MGFIKRNKVAFILIGVAVIFILLGVWREEYTTVIKKAVNICLECIGIG